MKLITFLYNGEERIGVITDNEKKVCPIKGFCSMTELIERADKLRLMEIAEMANTDKDAIDIEETVRKSPIPRPKQDVICLGINYTEHAKESERFHKEAFGGERPYPIYFSKRVNESPADGDDICGHFDIVDSLDYEVELGVIIGKDAKNVDIENVKDYIFGYTVINDVSARNVQTAHKQWYFGKSLDGFTPMGPCLVTADEIDYPPALKITSKINGQIRQNSTTDLLITDIDHIISELSKGFTLQAGTIIATGTPSGVGMGMIPPTFLNEGDIVECEIEKIGKLRNRIVK
ncbi:MAG: fumarylacetoacetate hydrolase family protein [Candidatus Metalachnospira sp.]|nr:fumarylacetoacetate hydrolase family protein [Candidatus Metalachnospira sp.]